MNKRKQYSHIKKTERLEIAILFKKGYSIRNIAKALGRSPSSVSDEIRINSVRGKYDPLKANHKAYVKRKYSKYQGMKVVKNKELRIYVEAKIRQEWSPEQIAGRIRQMNKTLPVVSYEGIYKYIKSPYGRQLERFLRYKNKKRKRCINNKNIRLNNRIFIDQRPEIIDDKARFGDFEADFVVSGKNGSGALLVLYERKSQYVLMRKIKNRGISIVHKCFKEITKEFTCFNSLTLDNDISFRKHEELSGIISAPIYFCHPYHSWEKGGVENMNKLIRQYIPKASDISKYADEYIREIQDKLNNRPRKSLNFKTPFEVMAENKQLRFSDKFPMIDLSELLNQIKYPSVRVEG